MQAISIKERRQSFLNKLTKNTNISKRVVVCFFITYLVLFVGAYLNSTIIRLFGMMIGFSFFFLLNELETYELLAMITPSSRLLKLNSDGSSLVVVCYLAVFIRWVFTRKVSLSLKTLILVAVLVALCGIRVFVKNYYDILLLVGIILAVFDWRQFLHSKREKKQRDVVTAFMLGVTFLFSGMILSSILSGNIGRMEAFSDDPNYTAVVFAVSVTILLYFLFNKIKFKHTLLYLAISITGGMLTGSRGFILSLGIVALIYSLYGLSNKRARKIIYIVLLLLLSFVILYLVKVPLAVSFYDKTIGRTIELKENYSSGSFMDISSGRFVLWEYYLKFMLSTPSTLFFGKGFQTYYLKEYGGYGMVAHNFIIAGIMGFGIIGLISIFLLYFSIGKMHIKNIVDLTLVSSFFIPYLFLDGILDFRIPLYFALFFMCLNIGQTLRPLRRKK